MLFLKLNIVPGLKIIKNNLPAIKRILKKFLLFLVNKFKRFKLANGLYRGN